MKKVKVSNWFQKYKRSKMLKFISLTQKALLIFVLSCTAFLYANSFAAKNTVDTLPDTLLTWLRNQPQIADVQNDGLVTFKDNQHYIIIQPAEIPENKTPISISTSLGQNPNQPDIYILSNGFYLVHVITQADGENSLPLIENFPMILKTGHIPKNFKIPSNLYVPNDWKSVFINRFEVIDDSDAMLYRNQNIMLWVSPNEKKLYWYQPNEAELANQWLSMSLPCKPINQHSLFILETNEVVLACQNNNVLYRFTPGRAGGFKVQLPATPTDMALDATTQTLYIAYANYELPIPPPVKNGGRGGWWKSGKKTKAVFKSEEQTVFNPPSIISVYDTRTNALLTDISVARAVKQLYFSGIRQQLVGLAIDGKALFFIPVLTPLQQLQFKTTNQFDQFTIENDKMLWLTGKDENKHPELFAYDLRWQELYALQPLKEEPIQSIVSNNMLYFLNPNEITRWDIKTQSWLSPLQFNTTNPLCQPTTLQPALDRSKLFITYTTCTEIGVLDLDQSQISSKLITPKTVTVGSNWQLYSILPSNDSTEQLAKIKLQDGRLLLQNGMLPQRVKWLSNLRAQTENQAQQEPVPANPK